MSRKTMLIGDAILSILAFPAFFGLIGSFVDYLGYAFIAGVWGIIVLFKKGYGVGMSIVFWLLFGWEFVLFLLFWGPLTLAVAALLPERRKCLHCRSYIPRDATRCPRCLGDLSVKPQPT